MSKRSGSFVTLAEVVEEVGRDVVRFTMLTRKNDAQMDFDFAKVVEASKDNPVFYVQYAHARICSLHRRARKRASSCPAEADLVAARRGGAGAGQARRAIPARRSRRRRAAHEPHRIAFYLGDLAAAFHALWNKGNDDARKAFPDGTESRIDTRAAGIGRRDRASCQERPWRHGRDGGRGDALMPRRRADQEDGR